MEEFKRMFIAMLFSVIAINASAYDFEVDGIAYNVISLSDRTCEVTNKWTWTSFDKYSGNVSIPKTVSYNGQTIRVIGIGDEAFEYCPDLLSVSIPNSVTSIGDSAFYQCTSLTSISIPYGVTRLGMATFYECTSLTSISIPNSVTIILDRVFKNCTSLTSISIPNSVTRMDAEVFENCTSLTSVTISNSLEKINYGTFYGCSSLTSVTIPNSVTNIHTTAFVSCGKLSSVILGNGITKVYKGDNDDGNVDNNGSVFYPSFEECDSLKTLSIASYDGMDMFLHSDAKIKIQTLVISKDYADTEIKTKAYQKAGLYAGWYEKISDKSFARLVCNVTTPPKIDDQFSSQQYASLEVLVPTSSLAAYQAADVWKKFWGLKGGAENFNIVTGISSPTMTKESRPRAIYNLNGMRIDAPRPGINIIRMSDGTTKKVLVK